MTVSELIQALSAFDGDLLVVTPGLDEVGLDYVAYVAAVGLGKSPNPMCAEYGVDDEGTPAVCIDWRVQ